MAVVTIGIDIGQRVDPTAIAVVEAQSRPKPADVGPGTEAHHVVRHLERLPLGTPYPAVGRRVAAVAAGVLARGGDPDAARPTLFADATGVGLPIVDALRDAGVPGELVPVFFTCGDKRTVDAGEVKLGKGYLVSRLQALLQADRLHLPDTAEARALAEELLAYEIRVDPEGDAKFGAFKVGTHDDLVTALGLAVQVDPPVTLVVGLGEEFVGRSIWDLDGTGAAGFGGFGVGLAGFDGWPR